MSETTKYIIEESTLTGIADAVRAKKGTSSPIAVSDLATEVSSIDTSAPIKLSMTFKNTAPSIAYGEIVLSASNAQYSGSYDIMWGDANGVMSNYSKIDTLSLDVANNKTMASIELMEYNAIPKYATRLCAVQSGDIVTSFNIPSSKVFDSEYYGPTTARYLLISDPHVQYETGATDTQVALTYGNEREDVDAVFVAGDLTSNGTVANLEEWKTIRDTYRGSTSVYSGVGNHEGYNASSIMATNPSAVREYLDTDWTNETATSFVKIIKGDVFIFVSIFDGTFQKNSNTMFSETTLTWLEGVLEQYRNQRCFVICHVPPHWETTGIKYNGFALGNGAYSYDIWGNPVQSNYPKSDRIAFLNMIEHYKNVILVGGHSHIKYEYQKIWKYLNVMQFKGGARFVHVSSLTVPRDIIDGSVGDYIYAESEGALMDVYPNHVRIRCRNFVAGKFYGLCEYIIDTTPVTIPPSSKTLVSISAVKTKTSYYTDETLSTADITVTATWSDSTTSTVNNSDVVFDTSNVDISTAGTYTIGISYTYGEDTETTSVQVTSSVRPSVKTLSTISATKTKTAYAVDETLSTADITVTATYSDNTTADVTASAQFDTSNVDMTTAGAYTIGVSYTEGVVTATTSVGVTVSSINPTLLIDATFSGSLTGRNTKITEITATVGTLIGDNYVYANDTTARGKNLYYRLLSNTGADFTHKVGFVGGVGGSYTSQGDKFTDYSLTATDWTPLASESSGNPLQLSANNSMVSIMFKASSSSTATFPVTVDCHIQIGYVD